MEFPALGQHCSEESCKKLDFLPVKCDACENIFCHSHMFYSNHSCPSAFKKDVQVPVCPLCNKPVPAKRGEQPDIAVGAHIDNNCQSDTAKSRRKVFNNLCSAKGCKVKELMPVFCSECHLNFCLKHRHPSDHKCEGPSVALRRKALDAAQARQRDAAKTRQNSSPSGANSSKSTHPGVLGRTPAAVQGKLSEDEALARALAASLEDSSNPQVVNLANDEDRLAQEKADRELAEALMQSQLDMPQNLQQSQTAGGSRDRCYIS